MKLLIAAALLAFALHYENIKSDPSQKVTAVDTSYWWRLLLIKTKSADGTFRNQLKFTPEKPFFCWEFFNSSQLVTYSPLNAYRPDTGTFKRSRDTLFLYRYKSGQITYRDTFLVTKQTKDSLVLSQKKAGSYTTMHFDNKKMEQKYRPSLATDFFTNATKWKLVSSESHLKYKDGQSTTKMNMLDDTNKGTEIFLFLGNDTIALRTTSMKGRHDTSYYRKKDNTLTSAPNGSDIMIIARQNNDSLILTQQSKTLEETTNYTERYAKSGSVK